MTDMGQALSGTWYLEAPLAVPPLTAASAFDVTVTPGASFTFGQGPSRSRLVITGERRGTEWARGPVRSAPCIVHWGRFKNLPADVELLSWAGSRSVLGLRPMPSWRRPCLAYTEAGVKVLLKLSAALEAGALALVDLPGAAARPSRVLALR